MGDIENRGRHRQREALDVANPGLSVDLRARGVDVRAELVNLHV